MSQNRVSQQLEPDDPRHGTPNGYCNLGCRCDRCRQANTDYCRERASRPKRPKAPQATQLPGESWRPAYGYEGLYEVSSIGRVRGLSREHSHWTGKGTVAVPGRFLSPAVVAGGYRAVSLSKGGHIRRIPVHTLVLEAFVSPRPDGMHCCHNNGRPDDNRLENLRWDTPSANTLDTVKHGTHPQGRKTHCVHGHEFTPENTLREAPPGGSPASWAYRRRCKECQLLKSGKGHGLGRGYANASKTHCKRGHEFTPENTYIKPTGRECRACARIHAKNAWARRAARKAQEAVA